MKRLATISLLVGGLTLVGGLVFDQWVARTKLPNLAPATSVSVLDKDSALLRAYTVADGRWRLPTSLATVDRDYVQDLIAYEDKRFFRHSGVDVFAFARAAGQSVWRGRVVSGGSTLTMQVARLLEGGPTGEWHGKLRQIRLALALERRLSKTDILNLYLILAPMGGNLEGVRAGSLAYFGKEPGRLTPAQSALLVALPQSPTARRPDKHPGTAQMARDRVLTRLQSEGRRPAEQVIAAKREPIPRTRIDFPLLAPHLADRLIKASPDRMVVETTLNKTLQADLERLTRESVADLGRDITAAILVADHQTGAIRASVGSADFFDARRQGFVDMTLATRSPGSTLKPLIYGLAFESGLVHPETLIDDQPTNFGGYVPTNFDRVHRGTVHVRTALQLSLNIPAVAALDAVGPARFFARLRKAGVAPHLPPGEKAGLATALGGFGVSLRDLVSVYIAIAHQGRAIPIRATAADTSTSAQILDPVSAWYVADILSETPPPDTGRIDGIAYKTGTSYGHRDAWAIGFDGEHVIGVWLGRADGTAVPGINGLGTAAPILFEAFARLKTDPAPLPAPPPTALTVANSELPPPLRQFRARGTQISAAGPMPEIAYPPTGAEIETGATTGDGTLVVKLRNGTPPFSWIVNGALLQDQSFERRMLWTTSEPGFVDVSVIDGRGLSASARYFLK